MTVKIKFTVEQLVMYILYDTNFYMNFVFSTVINIKYNIKAFIIVELAYFV